MPELPEVETIVRGLRQGGREGPPLVGRTFLVAQLSWERSLAEPSPAEFVARLPGQQVVDVQRRGKFILLQLTQDWLLFHLRMSGDLRVESKVQTSLQPHDRAVFELDHHLRLVFNDPRKFGRLWLTANSQEVLGRLGPEPMDPSLSAEDFYQRLHHSRRQLKPLLLDQSFLAGLGNIYTDEALHLARMHPLQASDSLDQNQASQLLNAIRKVLVEGIRRNGASIDWVYRGGSFQNHFRVYQRTGEPCPNCGTPVERCRVGQRSTHYCPVCQPLIRHFE